SIRWPSASTTSLCTDAFAISRKDRQRERGLHVKIALGDFGKRSIEDRLGALLVRRHKRQAIFAELRQLQHAVDVDAVSRVGGGHLGENAWLVIDREPHIVRGDEV